MTIDDLTDAYVQRLKGKIKNAQVESYPDDPKSYFFVHPIAALLVRYVGSNYPESGNESTGSFVVQERRPQVKISVLTRALTGPTGAGSFLDQVRLSLTGFRAPDCYRAYVADEGFEKFNTKEVTWEHSLTFESKTMLLEVPDEEQESILLHLTAINSNTTETLEVP